MDQKQSKKQDCIIKTFTDLFAALADGNDKIAYKCVEELEKLDVSFETANLRSDL